MLGIAPVFHAMVAQEDTTAACALPRPRTTGPIGVREDVDAFDLLPVVAEHEAREADEIPA